MVNSLIESLAPRSLLRSLVDIALVLSGALVLATMSQLAIPLWFTPVPLTLQTLTILLLPPLLGKKRAFAATLTYLLQGALGLPVFAMATCGLSRLIGPTGGFLLSFPLACWLLGTLLERGWGKKSVGLLAANACALLLVLLSGMSWLALYLGFKQAFLFAVLPFLAGEAVKVILACAIVSKMQGRLQSIERH